jgi:hypothetical protein
MSFRRTDQEENYKVTADWLKDFADQFSKGASFLDNIGKIVEPTKTKFGSIEEKMVDIRARVGFDSLATIRDEDEKIATASCCKCCEETGDPCKISTASEQDLKLKQVQAVLNYIKSMIAENPDPSLSTVAILEACRNHPSLNYLELQINEEMLKKAIDASLSSKNKEHSVSYPVYTNPVKDVSNDFGDQSAEYFNHAFPKI